MKKITAIILTFVLVFSLAACSSGKDHTEASSVNQNTETQNTGTQNAETPTTTEGERILVAYFSWADNAVIEGEVDAVASPSVTAPGNVAQMATWVSERTRGNLFSIQVTEPYSSDWDECLERANQERTENARPELKESVENIEDFDVVFLGFPKMQYGI